MVQGVKSYLYHTSKFSASLWLFQVFLKGEGEKKKKGEGEKNPNVAKNETMLKTKNKLWFSILLILVIRKRQIMQNY